MHVVCGPAAGAAAPVSQSVRQIRRLRSARSRSRSCSLPTHLSHHMHHHMHHQPHALLSSGCPIRDQTHAPCHPVPPLMSLIPPHYSSPVLLTHRQAHAHTECCHCGDSCHVASSPSSQPLSQSGRIRQNGRAGAGTGIRLFGVTQCVRANVLYIRAGSRAAVSTQCRPSLCVCMCE
jgi:hypothetical protein